MNIFLKYLLRNIVEKKFRTLLVVLAIAVSAGLFFATNAISTTSKEMMKDRVMQFSGNSDIVIKPKNDATVSRYVDMGPLENYKDRMKYAIGTLDGSILYTPTPEDMNYINVMGVTIEDIQTFNPLTIYQEGDLKHFEGNSVIISKYTADRYGLTIGNTMKMEVSDRKVDLTIAGIAQQKGYFANESQGTVAIIPKSTLDQLYDANGAVNTVYIKLQNVSQLPETLTLLQNKYPDSEVKESVNQAELSQSVSTVSLPFMVVSILAMFMSAFIVYTSFNITVIERLPVIGTFRSIGSTKKRINGLLLLESVLLGVIGGIAGCILGIIALYFMALTYLPNLTSGQEIKLSFTTSQLLVSIAFAIVLTVISALIPIVKTTKMPIKDIILNTYSKADESKGVGAAVGVILFVTSIIVPRVLQTNFLSFILNIACMVTLLVSLILLVPLVVQIIIKLTLSSRLLSDENSIAIKNIENNRSFLNNIKLIAVSIAGVLLIITISNSMSRDIENSYEKYHGYDIKLSHSRADQNFADQLNRVQGVKGSNNTYEMENVQSSNHNYYLNRVYGIGGIDYFNYVKANLRKADTEAIEQMNNGRNVVVTDILMSKLNVKIGDSLILDFKGKHGEYTITGSFDSSFNIGNMVFISADNMSNDSGLMYYTDTYVKTKGDVTQVYNEIKRTFLKDILLIRTMQELKDINKGFISGMFDIIIAYSLLAVLIGVVGIINNLIVSFIERKRFLGIYRSIGMSKSQLKKMLVTESTFIGIFGVLIGLIGAVALIEIVPFMLRFMYGSIIMYYSITTFIIFAGMSIVIMMLTSFIPVLKSNKMSIMETIKYE
ncbi:ABC transporter permease YtrF precursor [compost metagenome]